MAPLRPKARSGVDKGAVAAAARRAKIGLDLARAHAREEAYEKDL